ncbi:hypothetical protein M3Y99_01555700 [Aphelenchoides fujianensis]|nr:hypothetical protein M3Y99_01555700 [Aphelenchoides fujianensis]
MIVAQCHCFALILCTMLFEVYIVWMAVKFIGLANNTSRPSERRVVHPLTVLSDAQAKKITYPSYLRVNRCYSCMSPMYQELFRDGELSQFFFEPKNFTSQCENPMDSEGIGLVPCRAICLTLTQEFTVMGKCSLFSLPSIHSCSAGRKTGRKLTMRGCVNSLSRFGFHNQTIALFDQYDLCRDVRASDLFRFGTDTQPITVCSCLGDRCNGAALGGGARSSAFLTTTVGLLTLLTGFLLR